VKIRRHLTYANVTATLALLLAVGGGTAYAVDRINSHDIVNGSIRSVDLRNHKAVRGVDVQPNSLTGRQIKEGSLRTPGPVSLIGDETVDCVPASFTAFTPCASTALRLDVRSRVLLVATGNQESVGGPGQASCRMSIDGVRETLSVQPGEARSSNTSGTATNGFARTLVSGVLDAGLHRFALNCQRFSGRVRIDSPTIAAVAVGAG
jgi:hypothetical protein